MLKRLFGFFALFLALPAQAQTDPAAAFGARESIQSIRLSPDGRRLAYVAPTIGQGSAVYVVDIASGQSRMTTSADGRQQRIGGCSWASIERLICDVFAVRQTGVGVMTLSRLVALDSDGSDLVTLGDRAGAYRRLGRAFGGSVIDWRAGEDETVLMIDYLPPTGSRHYPGLGVVRVNTRTQETRTVESPVPNAVEFISDGRGNIRIMGVVPPRGGTEMSSDRINYSYRPPGSDEWRPLATYNQLTRDGLNPYAVDPELNVVYGFDKLNGRTALYRVALDGSGRREVLVSHDQVDVDQLLRIGRRGRVVGASYATDRRQAVYFDPELRRLSDQLSRALPNLPLVRFVDASDDESKLLIWAGSDTDPGRYYLYDKGTRQLAELMISRPQLEGVRLAQVRAVTYRAGDGTMIPAYLTLPPSGSGRGLPAIVMPHGGPGARDEWGFDWLAQFFANRGYAVLQPNFRGSAGYGDQWFQRNGFQSWRTAIGDVNDAGRWLVAEGIADVSKLAIVGWSYGGYAALQANVLDPGLFKAVVAIAPVTDLNALKEASRGWTSFANMRDFIGSGPHVREGSPVYNAAAIRAPVLLVHGALDRNVGIRHARRMRERLRDARRQVELLEFEQLDHYLEDSAARAEMLRRSDAFLRAALGMQ